MPPRDSITVLSECYLPARAKLLELAAMLDRIERAETASSGPSGRAVEDPRWEQLHRAIEILAKSPGDADRAAQIQHLFSRPYDENWQQEFDLEEVTGPTRAPCGKD